MLSTAEEIANFTSFKSSGGVKEPENLTNGKAIIALTGALSGNLSALIESEADYTADGVESLPAAILALVSELNSATSALSAWNTYLTTAADVEDLEQVNQGAKVYKKYTGDDSDEPWPSILPITSKDELTALESDYQAIKDLYAGLASVMNQINAKVWPDPVTTYVNGQEVTERPIEKLTASEVSSALAQAALLEALQGNLSQSASTINAMASEATTSRALAIEYFEQAVSFTLCSNQSSSSSVGDATKELFSY